MSSIHGFQIESGLIKYLAFNSSNEQNILYIKTRTITVSSLQIDKKVGHDQQFQHAGWNGCQSLPCRTHDHLGTSPQPKHEDHAPRKNCDTVGAGEGEFVLRDGRHQLPNPTGRLRGTDHRRGRSSRCNAKLNSICLNPLRQPAVSAVEQCPHRENVQFDDGEESGRCGLLCEIVSCGQELSWFRVPRTACEACVDGVPPSSDRLNPVLASFLHSAAAEIIDLGGTSTCDETRAGQLQEWARQSLEVEVSGGRFISTRPRSYRDCCHLGEVTGYRQQPSIQGLIRTAVHECHHPAHEVTSEAACNSCRDWSQNGDSQSVDLAGKRSIWPC